MFILYATSNCSWHLNWQYIKQPMGENFQVLQRGLIKDTVFSVAKGGFI